MSDARIRLGNFSDVAEAGELWLLMAEERYPDFEHDIDCWRANYLACLSDPHSHYDVFVADIGGHLVGFLEAKAYYCPLTARFRGHVHSIYLLPEFRRTCVASELAREAIRWGRKRELDLYEIACPADKLDFWLKKGYKPLQHILVKRLPK